MARNAMSEKAVQVFRGGLNKLGVWAENLGGACCEPGVTVTLDRLNPTINPENALVHTNPYGHRDYFRFSDLDPKDRRAIIAKINEGGIGTKLEVMVIPTFALLNTVHTVTHAEEIGLAFKVVTRNGTVLPKDQLIKVTEVEGGVGCGGVERTLGTADFEKIGELAGASRVHNIGVADKGGNFALDADVITLEVVSVPSIGVQGYFDIAVHANYTAAGRSEASM